jgi:ankyrin repeat protein
VKLLLEHGANLKRRITWLGGQSGMWLIGNEGTALHYAIRAGNLESLRLLVDAGLDPNAADDKGQTPLHIALHIERVSHAWHRDTSVYPRIIEYLLNNEASLRFTDREGRTAAELATQIESPNRIREQLRRALEERDAEYREAMLSDE